MGIGPVTASAAVATVGDFKQFKNGAQFGAWIGLTPRQHSSGGKTSLGGITKRGDTYLRTLLIQGAKSAVHDGAPTQRQDLALGARAARALGLAEGRGGAGQQERSHPLGGDDRGRGLRPNHLSVKPGREPERPDRSIEPSLHDVKTKMH